MLRFYLVFHRGRPPISTFFDRQLVRLPSADALTSHADLMSYVSILTRRSGVKIKSLTRHGYVQPQ
jgi:hypothetical protein